LIGTDFRSLYDTLRSQGAKKPWENAAV